jgi:hypothetical protein
MWVDIYVHEVLIRERMAEAQRSAARNSLIRSAGPGEARLGLWACLTRLQRMIQTVAPVVFP